MNAAANIASGAMSRAQERRNNLDTANRQKTANELERQQVALNNEASLQEGALDYASSIQAGIDKASDIRDAAKLGAQKTYLEQVAAQGQLLDTMQAAGEAEGTVQARSAASGIAGGTTLGGILKQQQSQKIGQATRQLQQGNSLAVLDYQGQMRSAARIESQYGAGSAYEQLYNLKRDTTEKNTALEYKKLEASNTYMDTVIGKQDYWKGGWFLADIFNVTSAASDFATTYARAGVGGGSSDYKYIKGGHEVR